MNDTSTDVENQHIAEATVPTFEDEINLDVLKNIPVTLSVEVGRTVLKIKDLLRLSEGSVVELSRLAGEYIDVCVNNTVIARGEVVMVNERYGIRLTQVLEASERIRTVE